MSAVNQHSPTEMSERAALYALGALRGEEARDFEAHLATGCSLCTAEVRSFSSVASDIGQSVSPQTPRAPLRARVLDRVAADGPTAKRSVFSMEGLLFARAAQLPWEPGRTPAINKKVLFRDSQRGYATWLVHMAPGSTYPAHRHSDVEELYLLEGDLLVSGVLMRAGDYCHAERGSEHRDVSTQDGCVFLALTSEHNELIT
jgi:quercetin dioxygenase-like cupin family protein